MALPGIKQFEMTGRAAIVTGGSKGLGKAMAAGLASAGADVLLVSRSQEEADAAAAEIAADHGVQAIGLQADVTCEEAGTAVIATRAESSVCRFLEMVVNSNAPAKKQLEVCSLHSRGHLQHPERTSPYQAICSE